MGLGGAQGKKEGRKEEGRRAFALHQRVGRESLSLFVLPGGKEKKSNLSFSAPTLLSLSLLLYFNPYALAAASFCVPLPPPGGKREGGGGGRGIMLIGRKRRRRRPRRKCFPFFPPLSVFIFFLLPPSILFGFARGGE